MKCSLILFRKFKKYTIRPRNTLVIVMCHIYEYNGYEQALSFVGHRPSQKIPIRHVTFQNFII